MKPPQRILFFSDWRIRPLELAAAMIALVAPVDVIVYGGDDVARFTPSPSPPSRLTINGRYYRPRDWVEPEDVEGVRRAAWEAAGCPEPYAESTPVRFALRRVEDYFSQFRDRSHANNWFSKLARHARFGVVGVIGNDCRPTDRNLLNVPGVRDVHSQPVALDGVGYIGVEGAIRDGERNAIGYTLNTEEEAQELLLASVVRLDGHNRPLDALVVVSHTPPYGCGLDTALRFGVEKLGCACRLHREAQARAGPVRTLPQSWRSFGVHGRFARSERGFGRPKGARCAHGVDTASGAWGTADD